MTTVDPTPVFSYPTSWSHGRGLAGRTGTVLGRLGCRKPLVLTDPILLSLGVVEPVLGSLREAGIDHTVCDAVNQEPTVDMFHSIVDRLDHRHPEVIDVRFGRR